MPESKGHSPLASLNAKLAFLGSPAGQQVLVKLLAATAKTQVDLGFRSSTSPWGFTWAPLKVRVGGKPLQDTRKHLQSSIGVRFGAGKFRLFTKFVGAAVHQYGATIVPVKAKRLRFPLGRGGGFAFAQKVIIPAREYLPVGSRLPDRWAEAFAATQRRFLLSVRRGEFDSIT